MNAVQSISGSPLTAGIDFATADPNGMGPGAGEVLGDRGKFSLAGSVLTFGHAYYENGYAYPANGWFLIPLRVSCSVAIDGARMVLSNCTGLVGVGGTPPIVVRDMVWLRLPDDAVWFP